MCQVSSDLLLPYLPVCYFSYPMLILKYTEKRHHIGHRISTIIIGRRLYCQRLLASTGENEKGHKKFSMGMAHSS